MVVLVAAQGDTEQTPHREALAHPEKETTVARLTVFVPQVAVVVPGLLG
jgi:hypothetical protein